jgi:hypothetical protein
MNISNDLLFQTDSNSVQYNMENLNNEMRRLTSQANDLTNTVNVLTKKLEHFQYSDKQSRLYSFKRKEMSEASSIVSTETISKYLQEFDYSTVTTFREFRDEVAEIRQSVQACLRVLEMK